MKYKLTDIIDDDFAAELSVASAAGIDIGSRGAKGVLINNGYLYTVLTASGVSSDETAHELLETLVNEAGISVKEVDFIVGTGYGRVALNFGTVPFKGVTEITCHALGAHYMNRGTRTIIDIGGQDSKAIQVDPENGNVTEFIMNDKCAAGTGRFLEKVAQLLNLDLDELGKCALRSENPAEISSQCVVFAESEVISLKAKGVSKEDIAAGIHLATARRVKGLLRRVGFDNDIVFTGGVSHNQGMVKALETEIGSSITKTKLDSTFAGAFGAAISAVHENKNIQYVI
ncbi:acyl-CoA dehydratase activase [Pseudobutyrivibrio sp.]